MFVISIFCKSVHHPDNSQHTAWFPRVCTKLNHSYYSCIALPLFIFKRLKQRPSIQFPSFRHVSHHLQRHRPPVVPISPLMFASGRPIPDDIRLVYRRPLTFWHVLHRFSLARLEISSLAARCRLMQPTSIRLIQRISHYSIYCTVTSVYTISKRRPLCFVLP